MNLLPPSAFTEPTDNAETCHNKCVGTGVELEADQGFGTILTVVNEMVANTKLQLIDKPVEVIENPYSSQIWDKIKLLLDRREEQSEKLSRLEGALHRTVPQHLEQQQCIKVLQDNIKELKQEMVGQEETIALLEKRLHAQSNVLEIQEKMVVQGQRGGMCEGWRNKVMQLLLEEGFDRYNSDKEISKHKNETQRIEKVLEEKRKECDVLVNKLTDQAANLKLKDKHITALSIELTNAQKDVENLSANQDKFEINNETIVEIISSGMSELDRLFERNIISEKVDTMQGRIDALVAQIRILKCLAEEKELFYSEKLESLLIEHTSGDSQPQSTTSQTDGSDAEAQVLHLKQLLESQNTQLNQLMIEKGMLCTQLSEAVSSGSDRQNQLHVHKEQLNDLTREHQLSISESQKRESKAAIRAKHLERQLERKCSELERLRTEEKERSVEEAERFNKQLGGLRSENAMLKTALRRL